MVLQVFVDESYRRDGEFVFGGFIAPPEKWAEFVPKWEECCREFGRKNHKTGAYHFHFKEMYKYDDTRENIWRFYHLIEDHATYSFSMRMHMLEFLRVKAGIQVGGQPVKYGPLGHYYRFAFFLLMAMLCDRPDLRQLFPNDQKLMFVFDEQMHAGRFLKRGWDEFWAHRSEEFRSLCDTKPVWASDDNCIPLQAADLWAGAMRHAYWNGRMPEFSAVGDPVLQGRRTDNWHIRFEFFEPQLVSEITHLVKQRTDKDIYYVCWGDLDWLFSPCA